jgi:glutamate racemase
VGGLAVYRAIRDSLPFENLIYVADTQFAPYGDKDPEYVEARTSAIAEFLTGVGVKAIVVACNTATTVAVRRLRDTYTLPVVGIEPGIKPAVQRSVSGTIVVLATQRTIESAAVSSLRERFGSDANIILQPCPGLVECVERGDMDSERTLGLLRDYTRTVLETDADVVVLGCTHYAFLEPQIRTLLGDEIAIIEPSKAVARQLEVRLAEAHLSVASQFDGYDRFFTSARQSQGVAGTMSKLLGKDVVVECINADD